MCCICAISSVTATLVYEAKMESNCQLGIIPDHLNLKLSIYSPFKAFLPVHLETGAQEHVGHARLVLQPPAHRPKTGRGASIAQTAALL